MAALRRAHGRGWPIAILAGIVVLLLIVVVLPVVETFGEQSDEIAQSQEQFAIYNSQIASRPKLEAQLTALNQREASTAGLLRGDSAALAAASMQSLVKALVERRGGQVRSVQNLPSQPLGGLEKIEVQYELSIPLGSLAGVAYQLETSVPYLFLDDVDVRSEEAWLPQDATGAPRDLHVQWTIRGYRWAGTP
jgi:general secretion pathway protein M